MPRQRPICHLGGPLADVDHVADPRLPLPVSALRFTHRPTGPQTPGQLTFQLPFSLHIKGSIDGFVGHPHLRIIGEIGSQPAADLFGTVLGVEPSHHLGVQGWVIGQLGGSVSPQPLLEPPLRHHR
jgi:hypothetical protein